jgi:ligand-binding sensor domain-containing protein/signal transduction histidine kinase
VVRNSDNPFQVESARQETPAFPKKEIAVNYKSGQIRCNACRRAVWLLLLSATLGAGHVLAEGGPAPTEWETRQWLKESGLPDNSVTCLLQTRDRFLWVGTGAGLARFDGNQFELSPDAGARPPKITCLFEAASGLLWVGTQDRGLMVVSNHALVPFQARSPLPIEDITGIAQDRADTFWIGTRRGLVRIRNDAVTRFTTADGLPDDYVSAIHSARSGTLWITTRQGMGEFRDDRFVRLEFQAQGLGTDPEFLGVYEDNKANVWAFGDTFLVNLKDGKRLNNFQGGGAASYRIWSLCEGRNGKLWISTSGQGLFSFDAGHFTPVAFRERMIPNDIRTVFEDDEGNIWMGTIGGGLIRMRRRAWQFLGEGGDLPNEGASCVDAGPDGRLLAGFLHGGLFLGKPGRFEAIGGKPGFETENLVTSVCLASNQALWVGTHGDGVYQLGETSAHHWTTANGLSDNVVTALARDNHGAVWVGCRSGKLHRIEAGNISTFGEASGLHASPVSTLAAVGDTMLIGMENGMVFQGGGSDFQRAPTPSHLQGRPVRALFADSRGLLWIGADGAGLMCVARGEPHLFDASNGFPDSDVRGIVEDPDHNLWVGAARGIWLVQKGSWSGAGPLTLDARQVVAEAPGLSVANLPGGPAATAADGLLYFASRNGLIQVNPRQWLANNHDIHARIQQVVLNNVPQTMPTQGTGPGRPATDWALKPRAPIRSLEFKFTAVSLGFPEQLRFQHYLEGFDSGWVDNANERAVKYGRLPYGQYRFRLRVARGGNAWSEMEHPLSFQLVPPVWRSTGAMTVYGLAGFGLIALAVRQISHRHLRRKMALLAQQQAMEKERMRIARNMHDDLGSKLARISLLSELVLGGKEPPGESLRSIASTSRTLLQTLDEIVWAVDPQNDTLENAAAYLGYYGNEYFRDTGLLLELKIPTALPHFPLSSETRHNLFLAFEEALGNVLKHSRASQVSIEMRLDSSTFTIAIRDNGRGFSPDVAAAAPARSPGNGSKRKGHGLQNMKNRLTEIGGGCRIESSPGHGAAVTLHLPLSPKSKPAL